MKAADRYRLIVRKLLDVHVNKTLKSVSQGWAKQLNFFRLMSLVIEKKFFILSCKFVMLKPPVAVFQPPYRAQRHTCTQVKFALHDQCTTDASQANTCCSQTVTTYDVARGQDSNSRGKALLCVYTEGQTLPTAKVRGPCLTRAQWACLRLYPQQ